MRYLKVCQSVNFWFNLNNKPFLYDMRFKKYTIVANSAILSLCDIKTLMRVAGHFLGGYIHASHMPKAFSLRKIWSKFPQFDSTIKEAIGILLNRKNKL